MAQSGQVVHSLLSVSHLKFSYVISSGNNAVVGIEDYLEFLIEDEDTEVIALYLEGIKYPDKFAQVLARAAAKGKPIVTLKLEHQKKRGKQQRLTLAAWPDQMRPLMLCLRSLA